MGRFVVGISGASGIALAVRLLTALGERLHDIDLVLSQGALYTALLELGKDYKTPAKFLSQLPSAVQQRVCLHAIQDTGSVIASGSYLVDAMIIVPCSMTTVAAIAMGLGDNALRRAADVTIKERRPLILVPRETPLSALHLENLLKLSRLGATIIPPMPAWYTAPRTVEDIEKYVVGKILDQLAVEHHLYPRWKAE